MRTRRWGSICAGIVVLGAAMVFVLFGTAVTWSGRGGEIATQSVFSSSDGLSVGSEVAVAGVTVGEVTSIRIDPRSDLSVVTFTRPAALSLPADTSLAIQGGGPGGAGTLSIVPGRSTELLAAGRTMTRTSPAANLEDAIGDYIFGDGGLGAAN